MRRSAPGCGGARLAGLRREDGLEAAGAVEREQLVEREGLRAAREAAHQHHELHRPSTASAAATIASVRCSQFRLCSRNGLGARRRSAAARYQCRACGGAPVAVEQRRERGVGAGEVARPSAHEVRCVRGDVQRPRREARLVEVEHGDRAFDVEELADVEVAVGGHELVGVGRVLLEAGEEVERAAGQAGRDGRREARGAGGRRERPVGPGDRQAGQARVVQDAEHRARDRRHLARAGARHRCAVERALDGEAQLRQGAVQAGPARRGRGRPRSAARRRPRGTRRPRRMP